MKPETICFHFIYLFIVYLFIFKWAGITLQRVGLLEGGKNLAGSFPMATSS